MLSGGIFYHVPTRKWYSLIYIFNFIITPINTLIISVDCFLHQHLREHCKKRLYSPWYLWSPLKCIHSATIGRPALHMVCADSDLFLYQSLSRSCSTVHTYLGHIKNSNWCIIYSPPLYWITCIALLWLDMYNYITEYHYTSRWWSLEECFFQSMYCHLHYHWSNIKFILHAE